jgi:hypothetical protein
MHIQKQVPIRVDVPDTARQPDDFGDPSRWGTLDAKRFSLGAGSDIAPLLHEFHDDVCQAPHWGYMISGELVVTYVDGTEETCDGNDLFHWPPGHRVRVTCDAEVLLFSPLLEHMEVMGSDAQADGQLISVPR